MEVYSELDTGLNPLNTGALSIASIGRCDRGGIFRMTRPSKAAHPVSTFAFSYRTISDIHLCSNRRARAS